VLVWVASYPRSGNTFLRIVLNRLYGVATAVIYDIDGVAERLGNELIGYRQLPGPLDTLRADDEAHFVKTHRSRGPEVDEDDAAICLVRDGRDSVVSWARQQSEKPGNEFRTRLRAIIEPDATSRTGSWGANVLSWLRPPAAHRALLRYEDLVRDPAAAVHHIVTSLSLPVRATPGATVPSFADLHATDPMFFRRGHTGTHRDELPDDLHQLFLSRPDNTTAMALLGYGPGTSER
jgi:hypothetical protein